MPLFLAHQHMRPPTPARVKMNADTAPFPARGRTLKTPPCPVERGKGGEQAKARRPACGAGAEFQASENPVGLS